MKAHRFSLMTFGLAFVVMGIAFARFGIFPFGNQQVMIIDNWHQYYPFMTEVQEKLRTGGSMFYSWKIGMGTNFWFLMAYYAMSPVYLLSVLVPVKYLPEFMAFATMFKISLAGAFFTYYLKKVYAKDDLSLVIFGLLYSFSGYLMGYYWNIMWLDSVVLLPILMLGLYRIVHDGKPVLYSVALGLTLITSFYIGYMVALFTFFYFFKVYFDSYKWNFKQFTRIIFRVFIWSVFGIGLSALVLLPAFKGLGMAYGAESADPTKFELYHSFIDMINKLWLGAEPTVRAGLPNIFSGLLGFLLIVLFFTSRQISVRAKATTGLVLGFLLVSFNVNYLNFIWHGLHFPNEVPYRFSFVFTFVLLTAAYEVFQRLEQEKFLRVVLALSGYLLIFEQFISTSEGLSAPVLYLNVALMGVYALTMYLWTTGKFGRQTFLMVLMGLVVAESLITANFAVSAAGTTTKEGYPPSGKEIDFAIQSIEAMDDGFYRMDMAKWYSTNDPVFYGYKGVSAFSSTLNAHTTGVAEELGLSAAPRANRLLYASNTPILNAFFNVKYIGSRGNMAKMPNAAYDKVYEQGDIRFYKSKYPLGIGFRVSEGILSWKGSTKNPFHSQSTLLQLASGTVTDVFVPLRPTAEVFTGAKKVGDNSRYVQYELDDLNVEGFAKTSYTVPARGQVYVHMNPSWSDDAKVTVNGETVKYDIKRGFILDLGILETGETFEVEFDLNTGYNTFYYLEAMLFNTLAFEQAYDILDDSVMEVVSYSDTSIDGKVTFYKPGILYTSIPYDEGWTVKVDGAEVEKVKLLDAFVGIPLSSGSYDVRFEYVPDGFFEGLSISMGALLAIIFLRVKPITRLSFKKKR